MLSWGQGQDVRWLWKIVAWVDICLWVHQESKSVAYTVVGDLSRAGDEIVQFDKSLKLFLTQWVSRYCGLDEQHDASRRVLYSMER